MVRKLAKTVTEAKAKEVAKSMKEPLEEETEQVDKRLLIPSGSTMLNLACSDSPHGAYVPGTIVNLIGDTSAGKSFLALTMLAEICYDKRFDDYELYYDDAEKTMEFNLEYLFGKKFVDRLHIRNSTYAEEVGDLLYELSSNSVKKNGKPFIYIDDSWDVLKSKYEEKKEKVNIGKRKKGQQEEGSYGDGKAKLLHKYCRLNISNIEKSNSLWVIVSQTKDNFGPDALFVPKIVTGGNAILFYPTHRVWLTIFTRFRAKKRETGVVSRIKVVKNKYNGKKRDKLYLPIYYDYGVDDIGSCITFLNGEYGEEHWKTRTRQVEKDGKKKSVTAIDAVELGVFLREKPLISYIEKNNLEGKLRSVAGTVWNDIEESIKLGRKPKFE